MKLSFSTDSSIQGLVACMYLFPLLHPLESPQRPAIYQFIGPAPQIYGSAGNAAREKKWRVCICGGRQAARFGRLRYIGDRERKRNLERNFKVLRVSSSCKRPVCSFLCHQNHNPVAHACVGFLKWKPKKIVSTNNFTIIITNQSHISQALTITQWFSQEWQGQTMVRLVSDKNLRLWIY